MRSLEKAKQLSIVAAVIFGIAVIAACSGGGGTSSIAPVQQPQSGAPQSIQTSIPLAEVGSAIALPSIAGYTESITLTSNAAPAGTLLNLAISTTMPKGIPAMPADFKETQGFLYFSISSSKTATLNGFPGFTLTVPSGVRWDGGALHLGFYDPAKGWQKLGDLTLAGRTMTFTPTKVALTLKAGVNYVVAPYACVEPSPTPTPHCRTIPLATATQLPIPALAGFTGDWVAGTNNAPAGTTVTETTYVGTPPGAPSPVAAIRKVSNEVEVIPQLAKAPSAPLSVSVKFSTPGGAAKATAGSTITFDKFPAVEFDFPTGFNTNGVIFKLETFDLTTGALLDSEAAIRSSSSPVVESFPGTSSPFVADTSHTYLWELVAVPLPAFVTEFPIPTNGGFPSYITSAGGDLWFTEFQANKVGRVTTGGTITEFSSGSSGAGPYDIITGPDGAAWFGAITSASIARISLTGTVTFVPIPTTNAHPEQLVSDTSANLIWFAESIGHKVGMYNLTTKTLTEFPISPGRFFVARPTGIALDTAGNVWVSDHANDQVIEMSRTGTILQRLDLPGSSGAFSLTAWYMTLGLDGNIWLTELTGGPHFTGAIARINPATLAITTFVPSGSSPGAIDVIAGPGGIWSAGGDEDLIRASYTGAISEFVVPGSLGYGIVVGPDSNLWFVDQNQNAIDRVTVSQLPSSSTLTGIPCNERLPRSAHCQSVVPTR